MERRFWRLLSASSRGRSAIHSVSEAVGKLDVPSRSLAAALAPPVCGLSPTFSWLPSCSRYLHQLKFLLNLSMLQTHSFSLVLGILLCPYQL
jgi:hypothetical protein